MAWKFNNPWDGGNAQNPWGINGAEAQKTLDIQNKDKALPPASIPTTGLFFQVDYRETAYIVAGKAIYLKDGEITTYGDYITTHLVESYIAAREYWSKSSDALNVFQYLENHPKVKVFIQPTGMDNGQYQGEMFGISWNPYFWAVIDNTNGKVVSPANLLLHEMIHNVGDLIPNDLSMKKALEEKIYFKYSDFDYENKLSLFLYSKKKERTDTFQDEEEYRTISFVNTCVTESDMINEGIRTDYVLYGGFRYWDSWKNKVTSTPNKIIGDKKRSYFLSTEHFFLKNSTTISIPEQYQGKFEDETNYIIEDNKFPLYIKRNG